MWQHFALCFHTKMWFFIVQFKAWVCGRVFIVAGRWFGMFFLVLGRNHQEEQSLIYCIDLKGWIDRIIPWIWVMICRVRIRWRRNKCDFTWVFRCSIRGFGGRWVCSWFNGGKFGGLKTWSTWYRGGWVNGPWRFIFHDHRVEAW